MIGVTLGIGEDYRFYAGEAVKRFNKFTGMEAVVIDQKLFDSHKHHPIFKTARAFNEQTFCMKLFLLDIFQQDICYFDSDYCAIDNFYPQKYFDGRFTAVRDRISSLFINDIIHSNIMNYVNAGFFMASYSEHKKLFDKIKKVGHTIPFKFHDQCMLNAVIQEDRVPVMYLDKRFNCNMPWGVMLDSDVKAVHYSSNYDHYKEGTSHVPGKKYEWDTVAMAGMEGLVTCVFEDGHQECNYLFRDGVTNSGNLWFATKDRRFILCKDGAYHPVQVQRTF